MRVSFAAIVCCIANIYWTGASAAPRLMCNAHPLVETLRCERLFGHSDAFRRGDIQISGAHQPLLRLIADTPAGGDAEQLKAQGDQVLATGDLGTARLYYSRAADLGSAAAAAAMGTTFDPTFLDGWHVRGIAPEPRTAESWYRKAMALGDKDATAMLRKLVGSDDFPDEPAQVKQWSSGSVQAMAKPDASSPAPVGLTQANVESILSDSGTEFHMVPREQFKVDLPDISYAWLTAGQVFGAVIQATMTDWHAEDAVPAFITKMNAGCTGAFSVKISPMATVKGGTMTRDAVSECETNSTKVRINYAFIQKSPRIDRVHNDGRG